MGISLAKSHSQEQHRSGRLRFQSDAVVDAIATYEAEMFARMQHISTDTMTNTEMFYAPDASDRVVALFRSFTRTKAIPPASEA